MAQQTLNTPREQTHQRIADALEDIVDKIVDTSSAGNIDYDNTESGLDATKVQGAVDELASEKVDKVEGKGLSTNDYTDADKNKLAGIEAEANKTVVDSAMSDSSTNPLQNRVVNAFLNEKTDVNNFNALTQEIELFNTYDLTNDVEISVFANDTYKRDKYDRAYETHIPNLDGEYSVSLGDKTFTETCTFTIANQGKSITEVFHTNRKYILGAKLLKAENDEVGDMHVIADVVTLIISKDAPYTTTFDPDLEHPPATGVLNLKVSVKPDEKYVNSINEPAYWGSYNGSDLLINNPILTYSETTFGQPKVSGNPITIEASESNLVECTAEVECVQEGSGDPSPDNVRPIIGQTEVVIDDVGKNLFDGVILDGYYDESGFVSSSSWKAGNLIKCYPDTDYVASFSGTVKSNGNVFFYDKDKNYISYTAFGIKSSFKTPNNSEYFGFYLNATNMSLLQQLELGSTATTYEPYKGKTYTIQLGDTIYGGELDVITGKMVVTHESKDLGDLDYITSSTPNYQSFICTTITDIKKVTQGNLANILTPIFENVKQNDTWKPYTVSLLNNSTTLYLNVNPSQFANVTDFKTAMSGQTLVYELAEPFTIQLTPQQIRLLKGTNHLSCNTGDLSIKYYPDNVLGQLKGDIEKGLNAYYDYQIQALWDKIGELQA